MRCDICGNQISKGECDTEGERIGNPFPTIPTRWNRDSGACHKVVVLNLCSTCVKKRKRREVWLCLAFALFVIVGTAMTFIRW